MRKGLCILAFIACLMFSDNASFATIQETQNTLSTYDSTVKVLADINTWLNPAYEIAGDDEEALAILNDLEIRTFPAAHYSQLKSKRIAIMEKKLNTFAILVLKQNMGSQWQEELNLQTMIHFQTINEPDDPIFTMVLHEHYNPSPLIRGLAAIQQWYYVKNCREDVGINYKHKRCFDMLFRLLTKKFGEKYIIQVRNRMNNKPVNLDNIYGQPSASKVEENMRRSLLYIQAEFTSIREKTYFDNDKALIRRLIDWQK